MTLRYFQVLLGCVIFLADISQAQGAFDSLRTQARKELESANTEVKTENHHRLATVEIENTNPPKKYIPGPHEVLVGMSSYSLSGRPRIDDSNFDLNNKSLDYVALGLTYNQIFEPWPIDFALQIGYGQRTSNIIYASGLGSESLKLQIYTAEASISWRALEWSGFSLHPEWGVGYLSYTQFGPNRATQFSENQGFGKFAFGLHRQIYQNFALNLKYQYQLKLAQKYVDPSGSQWLLGARYAL